MKNSLFIRSPLSTIFPIVQVPGRAKLVLSGDPLYIKNCGEKIFYDVKSLLVNIITSLVQGVPG